MAETKKAAPKPDARAEARDKVELTPSQYALEKVGEPAEGLEPAELLAHGERYAAAKAKRRWG